METVQESTFRRWVVAGSNALCDDSRRAYRFAFVALSAVIVLCLYARTVDGLSPVSIYPWDLLQFLDGASRIESGQVPHSDFSNPVGPITSLLIVLGFRASGLTSNALVYGNLLLGVLISLAGWFILRQRLPAVLLGLVSGFLFLLVVAFRPLGHGFTETSYAMIYNRYGYALLSLIALDCFLPDARQPRMPVLSGLLVGLMLGLAFYCKLTFFFFGIVFISIGFWLNNRSVRRIGAIVLGFFLLVVAFRIALGISAISYLTDFLSAGSVQDLDFRLKRVSRAIRSNWLSLVAVGLALVLWVRSFDASGDAIGVRHTRLGTVIPVTAIVIAGIALTATNFAEGRDVPIFLVAGVLIVLSAVGKGTRFTAGEGERALAHVLIVAVVLVFLYVPIVSRDASSIVYARVWNRNIAGVHPVPFKSERLSGFIISPSAIKSTSYSNANGVPDRINDGIRLLQDHIGPGTKVSCLCYTNPFSFAMNLEPPAGTPLWMELGMSFSSDRYPDAASLFRDVDIVMIPRRLGHDDGFGWNSVDMLNVLYGHFLEELFDEAGRSDSWILLKRTGRRN